MQEQRRPFADPASSAPSGLAILKAGIIHHPDDDSPPSRQPDPSKGAHPSPVKRKPLPFSATPSPFAVRFPSAGGKVVGIGIDEDEEAGIVEKTRGPAPVPGASPNLVVRDLDQFPRGLTPAIPQSPGNTTFTDRSPDVARQVLRDLDDGSRLSSPLHHVRMASDPVPRAPLKTRARPVEELQRSTTMPSPSAGGPPPLPTGTDPRANPRLNEPTSATANASNKGLASASSKLTSFFGWKGPASSPVADSLPTTPSDRDAPSPFSKSPSSFASSAKSVPRAIDTVKANAPLRTMYFATNDLPNPPLTPAMSIKVEELEEELREISTELASSIRRELELEEEVERLLQEGPSAMDQQRRTSDYYSDSGTSSVRYPLSDTETKPDSFMKLRRRSEQESAQLKLDLSQKLQEERVRRKAMEAHIKSLEDHIQNVERNQGQVGAPRRIQELENLLDVNRRKLQEERQHRENFEDLLAALRGDLQQHRNERDNLRDEVVPQLKARVQGLEADAAKFQNLTYEHTRMQQELQALRAGRGGTIGSIAEEGGSSSGPKRSASQSRGAIGSLSRSNSISKDRESRESLADRVKEIELQRDSLHRALKSLLDRQKHQTREHEKRVKSLEQERDRALESHSPRRLGYEAEVKELRHEINELRKRADDALEQKWQCEKGLGGLKKDLERADQETSSLRNLLHENEIPIPGSSGFAADTHATSASLERAYRELREAQALSVSRLRDINGIGAPHGDFAKTNETMDMLLKTMSSAEAERDFAQKQADAYRAQAVSLQEATAFHSNESAGLAEQLRASAKRVDALASQVRYQLECNGDLRTRLSEAVGKGERNQKVSAARINQLQAKLKSLEDNLMSAQQHSEEAVSHHEDEVRSIRDSHHAQLQRLKNSMPKSPSPHLNPPLGNTSGARVPRSPALRKSSSIASLTMNEATRTEFLERRVKALEMALAEADGEMHEVVQKMNMAQIEVMELQSARDEAMRSTRMLQKTIVEETSRLLRD